jgi:hypothetical protein
MTIQRRRPVVLISILKSRFFSLETLNEAPVAFGWLMLVLGEKVLFRVRSTQTAALTLQDRCRSSPETILLLFRLVMQKNRGGSQGMRFVLTFKTLSC